MRTVRPTHPPTLVPAAPLSRSGRCDDTVYHSPHVSRPDATRQEVEAAARAAYAHDFIESLPEGYNTIVGERGAYLSGGQRQRFAIARALVLRPKLVVLDEPVSALDVSIRGDVLELLADLREKFGIAYLFVSHDLDVVRAVADRVLVMEKGCIVEQGDVDAVFDTPQAEITKRLLDARLSIQA